MSNFNIEYFEKSGKPLSNFATINMKVDNGKL
jgi:hypothetical protein